MKLLVTGGAWIYREQFYPTYACIHILTVRSVNLDNLTYAGNLIESK